MVARHEAGASMNQVREPDFDRAVALVLRVGAFGSFIIMLSGLIAGLFVSGGFPLGIERAGVLLMLATPVVRVVVACFLFFREKDTKYGWISLGVLLILMLGTVFGIGEH
jgi:uncharacterized membrane protein